MLGQQTLHVNVREQMARSLGLSLKKFDALVTSANQAYEVLKELGPFYGRDDIKDPTFRIGAEPIKLPKGSKKLFTDFGNDLLYLARALDKLSDKHKEELGEHVDFRIPPTWRIDAIWGENGQLKVNEIEGVDSASALMIANHQAFSLQSLRESTAAKLAQTLRVMCQHTKKKSHKIALIRTITPFSPHTVNAEKFIKFIEILSKGTIEIDLLDATAIKEGTIKPEWGKYSGITNEQGFAPNEILGYGAKDDQILSSGNYNAIGNKGVFALLFDDSLNAFWAKHIGKDRHDRLRQILLPTRFIKTVEELEKERENGNVVKVAWAGTNTTLINRSKGVAMPIKEDVHGTEERWQELTLLLQQGVKIIAQDFIMPAKVSTFLRKKGTTLEPVAWNNRVCVKFVVDGHPYGENTTSVNLTAVEVTLGPDVIPAGRKCAFIPGVLQ